MADSTLAGMGVVGQFAISRQQPAVVPVAELEIRRVAEKFPTNGSDRGSLRGHDLTLCVGRLLTHSVSTYAGHEPFSLW
jgi:hypothetical protein